MTTKTSNENRRLHLRVPALAVALVAVLAVVLTSCANDGNTAVRVGETSYSLEELDTLTTEYLDQTGQHGIESSELALIRQKIAAQLLVGELMHHASTMLGVSVTDQQVELSRDQLINSGQYRQGMLTTVIPESRLDEVIRWSLERQAVGNALVKEDPKAGGGDPVTAAVQYQNEVTREVGVYVNPRLGAWSGTQLIAGGGHLVVPSDPNAAAGG